MSVPLSTIKSALKIDYADDDTDLIRLREAASQLVERRTQIRLAPVKETLYLADWTDTMFPVHPFVGVVSVNYTNSAGGSVAVPAADYWLDRTQGPIPVLRFLERPAIKEGTAILVEYNVGFDAVPDPLVHAIIAIVGAWYNNPEAFQPIGLQMVPMSVDHILDHWSTNSRMR